MKTAMSKGIFEKRFNRSISDFHTTVEIENFIQERLNITLKPRWFTHQNFVRSQGCVFPVKSQNINKLLDSSLKEDKKWQHLRLMK